jgi:hypothetical protein
VFSNWQEILASEYLILMLALGMFGISIFLDVLSIQDFEVRYFWEQLEIFLEDGFKFGGIATWLTYFVRYAIQHIETIPEYTNTQPPIKILACQYAFQNDVETKLVNIV